MKNTHNRRILLVPGLAIAALTYFVIAASTAQVSSSTVPAPTPTQKKVILKLAILGNSNATASADRKLLDRVLDNLVGNAIKFTPPDGTITVTTRSENGRVHFDVVDTGRGIPREANFAANRPALLMPFVSLPARLGSHTIRA